MEEVIVEHHYCTTPDCQQNDLYNTSNHNYNWTEMACVFETSPEDLLLTPIFQAFVYVMYSAIFIVALLGNGLVCFVVHSLPRMKTVTNYFIVNLAVGDILMTVFCVPFTFVSTLALRYWPFGALMCKIVNYSQAVSVFVSAYTLLAISIDRYIVITRPLQPRLGKATARLVVAAVWAGALATAAPIPVVSQLQRPSLWHEACNVDVCGERWPSPEQSEQYTCALLVLQFALPLGALVVTYARIAHVVWGGRPPGEAHTDRDSRLHSSKRKMVKMMVTVVAVFTVCWLPLNVFILLWTAHEGDEEWSAWPGMPYLWFASHWLAMSHCCYNPIIYCYMNARYRRGFKQVNTRGRLYGVTAVWQRVSARVDPMITGAAPAHEGDDGTPSCDVLIPTHGHWHSRPEACNRILGGFFCLKLTDSNHSTHRLSICEGVPLSDMVAMKGAGSLVRRPACRCRRSIFEDSSVKCVACSSLRQLPPAPPRPVCPPARALSVRSEFTY